MNSILIKNATLVNEGKTFDSSVLITNGIIEKIGEVINVDLKKNVKVIDAKRKYLFPGIIDAHVHFREPGLTHKGDIHAESRAAVAGGVTSFFDMPNTIPNVISQVQLDEKNRIAATQSLANYSFFMGINNENHESILQSDHLNSCGLTDDGLYSSGKGKLLADNPERMEKLFSSCNSLIAIHSEKEQMVEQNEKLYRSKYGVDIPIAFHPLIRSEQNCVEATRGAISIARKYNARLHILHLTTEAETHLFQNDIPLKDKRITTEVCPQYLWFCDQDYDRLGTLIKWNPAIKTELDREGLLLALLDDRIDIIASDHAPHTLEEKNNSYFCAPSGAPMVQHSFIVMLELYHRGLISLGKIAEKMCHNVAELYRIEKRGYIREGYYADLTIIDLNSHWKVSKENIYSKCGWSPLEGELFHSKVTHTLVNGNVVYEEGRFNEGVKGNPIAFHIDRQVSIL